MRRTLLRLTVVATALAAAAPASAQMVVRAPPHLQSLDLPIIRADVVVTGWVADIQPDPANQKALVVTFNVSESLKGGRRDRLIVGPLADAQVMDGWMRTSALLLLAIPAAPQRPTTIDLSDEELAVMTADLTLLRTADDVLQAAREMLRRTPGTAKPATFGVAVHATQVAQTRLDTRGPQHLPADFLFVDVPVNERLERRAREAIQSEAREVRINGARALRLFSSPLNVELLRPLLDDDGWVDEYRGLYEADNALRRRQYNNVRREAYTTLRHLGANVEEPESLRPADPDEQVMALALDDSPLAADDIRTLTRYPNLAHLYLSGRQLTPDQWAAVGQLRSLEALYLEGSNVDDESLRLLSALPSLAYLGLANTPITDAGLLELARFAGLKKVDLGQGVSENGVAALTNRRPDIRARLDEFAFLARLRPRRVEQPLVKALNWLLPVASARPGSLGLRCYALIFPADTARQVDDLLRRELPPRGWASVPFPGYRRDGVPVPVRAKDHAVDEVFLNGRDWPYYAPAQGERMIVISWNVDPHQR